MNECLIKAYGNQIEKDIEIIKAKFTAVIAAHITAETIGNSPLCRLNRALIECLKEPTEKEN